jgi:cytochrome P450
MQPAFHRQQIQSYCNDMVALTAQMLDCWRSLPELDLHAEMRQLTQRIAVKTLFGSYEEEELDRVGRLLREMIDLTSSPLFLLAPFNLPGLPFRRAEYLAGQLEAYIRSMIARKRADPAASDVLSALVHARDEEDAQLTDEELVGHAFTLFVAGHETTSNALVWTLFLLDQHPQAAAALLAELEGALGGEAPTVERLGSLPLLDGVVRESLRLLPPAIIGIRTAAVPCELGGYALPQGTNIFYSEFITHRMPELYSEPNRFRPERWTGLERTAYEYLPFGAGPHMCIGWAFAMQELKVVLAMLLPRYRLSLAPGSRVDTTLHMRPAGGMRVRVHDQDHCFQASPVRGKICALVDLE